MIIRIVKMTFKTGTVSPFLEFLSGYKSEIRASPGCTFLQVLQDSSTPEVLMTLSHWQSEEHLNRYRQSELFKKVWSHTKIHFAAPPEALSLSEVLG